MIQSSNEGLKALDATLDATNVLSEEFKRTLVLHAQHACSCAFQAGIEHAKNDSPVRQPTRPDAEAERIRARMLDLEPYSP